MFRVGFGFDSHPFDENKRGLKLGGVFVEADFGLKGHSDADVLLHAITDAILGALSAPDIGELFPPSDPQWKDADSVIFLKEALKIMRENGYRIGNIDCTLVCEKPKISPLKGKVRKKLSQLLEIDEGRVNIKGKTPEGFCSLEGIAVYCVALLVKE